MIRNILCYAEESARRFPGKTAFADEETACTYDELIKSARAVDITDYLPEDISLTDENAGSVVVTVGIDKDGTKSYDISMGAIKVNNLANGLSLSYESADVLEIQIRGPGDILDQYKISDNVSIDLKNYQTAGTYTVPVTVGVPDGCVLESTVSVNVILEEK